MKYFLFFSLFLYNVHILSAQRPSLDSISIRNWPSLGYDPDISNDGNYFLYTVNNHPPGSQTLIVKGTTTDWQMEFTGASSGFFTADNKQVLFKRNDTLFFWRLGSVLSNYITNISSFKQPRMGKGEWLAYQLQNNTNDLVLMQLSTDKEKRFASVLDYSFNDNGTVLLLKSAANPNSASPNILQWVNLTNDKIDTIWEKTASMTSNTVENYIFDEAGAQLAFIVQEKRDTGTANTLWYYNEGMKKAALMANNQSVGITPGFTISSTTPYFSASGRYIFFTQLPPTDGRKPKADAVKVDVWSYQDSVLQSTQLMGDGPFTPRTEYTSIVSIAGKHIIRLEQEDESLVAHASASSDYIVVTDKKSITDYWWNSYANKSTYLVSLKDGARKLLYTGGNYITYQFSSGGKYLVYYDPKQYAYFSYHLPSGRLINISGSIPIRLTRDDMDSLSGNPLLAVGIAGWLPDDDALFIYDNYDIWKVDLSNITPPLNITNGYGRAHDIKLRAINEGPSTIYDPKEPLLLAAFNTSNKQNGFYRKTVDKKGDPELLTVGPYFAYTTDSQCGAFLNVKPFKAANANKWIVRRQSATDAPNFFLTTDFKNYDRLTNLQPQKEYNWLTTELITWKTLDGTMAQGVLYKPENFDSTKKYPIIFKYYEQLSQMVYHYPEPEFSRGDVNIPWFVSRGYLVFTPDIRYIIGQTGESVYNSVVSAAQYFSQMPWVYAAKMGINGHSFGGYETNYLVTHTSLFAAAATAAGPANFISHYGGIQGKIYRANSGQAMYETSQMRMSATLWQTPDLYIKNSPVFSIDKVTTPILIMHNKADDLVPWMQSVELFTGLRRLGKKAWMLQYDEGGHGIHGKEAEDFTIRLTQFFDHYLKNASPPRWMTEGIPAKLKGIETGYELDTSGREP